MSKKSEIKKSPTQKKKLIIILSATIFAIVIGFGINYLVTFLNYERDIDLIEVQNIDLNTISDGEYIGSCDVDLIRVTVRVAVENHRITELELLEHYNDRGAAANALPSKILEEQRIDVDAVSGATASSKVIQEAIYNALTGKRTIRS